MQICTHCVLLLTCCCLFPTLILNTYTSYVESLTFSFFKHKSNSKKKQRNKFSLCNFFFQITWIDLRILYASGSPPPLISIINVKMKKKIKQKSLRFFFSFLLFSFSQFLSLNSSITSSKYTCNPWLIIL